MTSSTSRLQVDPSTPLTLVLAVRDGEEAQLMERVLGKELEDIDLYRVAGPGQVQALLDERDVDAILLDHAWPQGTSLDLLHELEAQGSDLPVLVILDAEGEDTAVAVMRAGASDYVRRLDEPQFAKELTIKLKQVLHRHRLQRQVKALEQEREQMKLLDTVRRTVATVKHEINNPLAIISGNAQLLLELARATELDESLIQPIQDIEEASQRIAASLDKLANLKEIITRRYVEGENGLIELGE